MLIPKLSGSVVGINITPRMITLSWIERQAAEKPYQLQAYKNIIFEVQPKTSLVLFNPTRLRTLINTFITLHNLRNACIVIALSGQELIEKQVMLAKPAAELNSIEDPGNLQWHYYCLQKPTHGDVAPWYSCGISRELLLQYQLLAIRCDLNLIQITTPTMALFKAYKFLKQKSAQARRSSSENLDAGQTEQPNRTNIVNFLNLNGHIRIRSHQEHAAIVECFGLYLLGKSYYGEN